MVVASLFTLLAAVFLVQLVLVAYLQGVVRTAADEAVRAGSRVGAGLAVCETHGTEVFGSLLPGQLGSTGWVSCTYDGGVLVSQVEVTFDSPTIGFPSFAIRATGRATQESGS